MKILGPKVKRFLWPLPLVVSTLILILLFLPFYKDGKMILGGEGSYYLDFPLLMQNYGFTWFNYGVGIFGISVTYVFHLSLLQKLISDERVINFIMVFSMYYLPFLAIYLLALELRLKPWMASLIAAFYIVNPFSSNFLKSINQWNMLSVYILPAFFLIILKFYNKNWLLFFLFGFHSLIFAFTNANPPTMVIYQVAIVFFVIFISFYKEQKFNLAKICSKYFLILSSFVLFNFWWIINWFYIFFDAQQDYSKEAAVSWVKGSGKFIPAMWRSLNLTGLLEYPIRVDYDYFASHYSHPYATLILLIPIAVIIYFLFKEGLKKKHLVILGIAVLAVAFLSKGINGLFGDVYESMMMNVPLFSIFRSAAEKWGVLLVFLLTLYIIFAFIELRKDKFYYLILGLFGVYVFYGAIPFMIGQFLPDYKFDEKVIGSKNFVDKAEYKNLRNELNADPAQYRVLSLPGSLNYQVALSLGGDKFYTGNDPVMNNINKPFIAPYNGNFSKRFNVLFDSVLDPDYLNILGLYNIKKVVINKDIYPWFGFKEKYTISEIEGKLDKDLASSKNRVIDLYDSGDYFLPRFYVPKTVIYSPLTNQGDLLEIFRAGDLPRRGAIFFDLDPDTDRTEYAKIESTGENFSGVVLVGKIQSTVNEEKLRAGVEGVSRIGVLFPYVRWKPGTFPYSYIQEKEQRTKSQFVNNPELLFEQNLFFASKRISEIQKWERELTMGQFSAVLGEYEREMKSAIANLTTAKSTQDPYKLLVKIEVTFGAQSERLMNVLKGNYSGDETENERIKLANSVLANIDNQLKGFITGNYLQTRYYFDIPEDGEYEILVTKDDAAPDWVLENITSEINDKFTASVSSEQNNKWWLSFGKRDFGKGAQFLSFKKPSPLNLLTSNWNRLESSIELGEKVRLLGQENPTVYQDISNWQSSTNYKLSLFYKTNNDSRVRILLTEREDDFDENNLTANNLTGVMGTNILFSEEVGSEGQWEKMVIDFRSGDSNAAKLFISGIPGKQKISEIEFKDVRLELVDEPKIILRRVASNQNANVPKITFTRINPTKYIINVENATSPYFLVFSESFYRGWKAYISDTNIKNEVSRSYFNGEINEGRHRDVFIEKSLFETWNKNPLPEEKHFLINGYANSWYIAPEDSGGKIDYQIVIEYWPQRLFYIGSFITILAFVLASLFGIGKLRKK